MTCYAMRYGIIPGLTLPLQMPLQTPTQLGKGDWGDPWR
jgi:hypothetical protein